MLSEWVSSLPQKALRRRKIVPREASVTVCSRSAPGAQELLPEFIVAIDGSTHPSPSELGAAHAGLRRRRLPVSCLKAV